jgi:O-antigen/teichoic acid export membrane protein
MLAPAIHAASKAMSGWQARLADLLSLRYALLRGWTAGSALLAGLIQTFVFARVLSPERFSLFILVGAFGVSMWLFDLGLSKILFVKLRKRYLSGEDTLPIAAQANAIAIFYALAIVAGAVICFGVTYARSAVSAWQAVEFALFFFFTAFNLAWFVLRNASVAVDEYIYFETLESWRRVAYIGLMLAMLAGLPFAAFVVLINLGWVVLVALAGARLVAKGAITPQVRGLARRLAGFFRENWRSSLRTGAHAAGEVYTHNVLYLVVPITIGLGAPTIVLDTTLKIFFGTLNLCSAACDLLVPRQTAAYSARDARTLLRATLAAVGLCLVPVLAISALLLVDAKGLFALLLGHAAAMPPQAVPILLVLLATAAFKSAPNFLLQHTGYFRDIARLSLLNVLLMSAAVGIGLLAKLDLIGLLEVYAVGFVGIAAFYIVFAIRGPLRDAARPAP